MIGGIGDDIFEPCAIEDFENQTYQEYCDDTKLITKEVLQNGRKSLHFRINEEYEHTMYQEFLNIIFNRYVMFHEMGRDGTPHFHVWCYESPYTLQQIRTRFVKRFPQNGNRKYSLQICRTDDWTNLLYCSKDKNLIQFFGIKEGLINLAMDESYQKPINKNCNNKWALAKAEFTKYVTCQGLEKLYTKEDVLRWCIEWYSGEGPFNEGHIEKLYNYVMCNSKRLTKYQKELLFEKLMYKMENP